MAAFGGSVTYGVGSLHPHVNGWLHRFFAWVQATFPHSGHKLLNFVRPLCPAMHECMQMAHHLTDRAAAAGHISSREPLQCALRGGPDWQRGSGPGLC